MIILDYNPKKHKQIIHACTLALKKGKIIAYPTDTSYGLACDATNITSVKKLYALKGRTFKNPVHVVVISKKQAQNLVAWNKIAEKLSRKFWLGAVTLVLPLRSKNKSILRLSANTGFLGLRMPKNKIALDLVEALKKPVTATSANVSGKPNAYSAEEILKQFKKAKYKPDIILNAGRLPKTKPSTVVKIKEKKAEVLRVGPVSKKQIEKIINN